MSLPPGQRILINDTKPGNKLPMAIAHNVPRNEGIKTLGKSASGASLVISGDVIKKYNYDYSFSLHNNKFLSYCFNLARYGNDPSLKTFLPEVLEITHNCISMRYYKEFEPLQATNTGSMHSLVKFLDILYKKRYKKTDPLDSLYTLTTYMDEKVHFKIKLLIADDDKVFWNKIRKFYRKIKSNNLLYDFLSPKYLHDIHGDLTFSNILSKEDKIIVIDFDNDDKVGFAELDFAKLLQSHLLEYEYWPIEPDSLPNIETGGAGWLAILKFYQDHLSIDENQLTIKGIFYLTTHLVRMYPYQQNSYPKNLPVIKYFLSQLTGIWDNLAKYENYIK
jgi:thiamine kinase-like enzyme